MIYTLDEKLQACNVLLAAAAMSRSLSRDRRTPINPSSLCRYPYLFALIALIGETSHLSFRTFSKTFNSSMPGWIGFRVSYVQHPILWYTIRFLSPSAQLWRLFAGDYLHFNDACIDSLCQRILSQSFNQIRA